MGNPYKRLPTSARPRERLVSEGLEALSAAELLALQLRSGRAGRSASDLASDLLAEFGSIRRISESTTDELARVSGVGPAKAASVVAAFELGRRLSAEQQQFDSIARASDVAALAAAELDGLRRERVLAFIGDRRCRVKAVVRLSEGTVNRTLVGVREVLNAVLRHDGSTFALAHNHPSGDVTPSAADIEVTRQVAVGAKTVGLRFLGHVIVAGDHWSEVEVTTSQQTPR